MARMGMTFGRQRPNPRRQTSPGAALENGRPCAHPRRDLPLAVTTTSPGSR
jgi:hypothetical protein